MERPSAAAAEPPRPLAFLLAPQAPATGNAATAARLRRILEARGMRVLSMDPASVASADAADGEVAAAVDESGAVVVVALHGIKAARLVVGCKAPMILVTGGTDVNVDIAADAQKAATMARVLRWEGTAAVVSFSGAMLEALHALLKATVDVPPASPDGRWRAGAPPVHLIPQGVELPPRPGPGSELAAEVQRIVGAVLREGETIPDARGRVLVLVAGLRPVRHLQCPPLPPPQPSHPRGHARCVPEQAVCCMCAQVKDVLYLADAVDRAWGEGQRLRLVLVGGWLDDEYATSVKERAAQSPGAFMLLPDVLSREVCIELMRHCAAVVNSSTSEGMSGALLEALAVGTPVLARNIAGNVALADVARSRAAGTAGEAGGATPDSVFTGGVVIYDSPEDFVQQSEALFLAGSVSSSIKPEVGGTSHSSAPLPLGSCPSASELGAEGLRAAEAIAADERSAWHAVLDTVITSKSS